MVDYLTCDADVVVRYQGGTNAGHTVKVGDTRFVFHAIPAGIMHPDKVCVIGNGVVLDPEALIQEARCYLSLADAPDQSAERATSLARALRAFHELSIREPEDPRGPAGEAHCRFTLALERATVPDAEKNRIRELWQKAARLAPADPTPRFNLALFLESKLVGDRAAAIATYRATLARDATHLPSLVNLARLLWVDGDHDAAKALYRRALPKLEDERERREVRRLLKQ